MQICSRVFNFILRNRNDTIVFFYLEFLSLNRE